jgi:hypothetical protein
MKSIISFVLAILVCCAAWAEPIVVHVPYSQTGNAQALTRLLTTELATRGWEFDVRVTHNPRLSQSTFNSATRPFLLMWGNDLTESERDPAYLPPPTASELLTVVYIYPSYICTTKNITKQDFERRGSGYTIGTIVLPFNERYLQSLNQHLGTRHRVIKYNNSKETELAFAAGEVDFVFSSIGAKWQSQSQARCLYNSGTYSILNIPTMQDSHPYFEYRDFANVAYLRAKNFDAATLEKLRRDMLDVQRNLISYNQHQQRNFNPMPPLTPASQFQLVKSHSEATR